MFFRVHVFQGPGFSGFSLFRVQIFQGLGFLGSRFFSVRVQVLEAAKMRFFIKVYCYPKFLLKCFERSPYTINYLHSTSTIIILINFSEFPQLLLFFDAPHFSFKKSLEVCSI